MLRTTINGHVIEGGVDRDGDVTEYWVTIDGVTHVRTPHRDTASDYLRNAVDWAHMRGVA